MESLRHENSKNLFYLAPLRGVTDHIFRNTYERYFAKFDYLLAPFITKVRGTTVNPSHLRDISPDKNDSDRVIPQIIGNNADEFLVLASAIADLGYKSVNWNLGCPFPPVTRKKRGSGLLPYPELIELILEKVMKSIPLPLSIKVRIGLDDENEIFRLIPVLNSFPLQEIIIHPRTGAQMYSGEINHVVFQECSNLCSHPVVYNGDIVTLKDFQEKSSLFPTINRWMLGRGVIKNPFLLQSLSNRDFKGDPVIIRKFHDEIYRINSSILCGQAHILGRMKELWIYLSESFSVNPKVLKKILRSTSTSEYEKHVETLFAQLII